MSNESTPQPRTRNWTLAAIALVMLITGVTTYPDYPGRNGAPLAAPNTQTITVPDYPTITFADLPYGCTVKDDGSPDMSDPLCTGTIEDAKRYAVLNYRTNYQHQPAFNCADGRNNNRDHTDLMLFEPCPNGALHLRLKDGQLKLVTNTSQTTVLSSVNTTTDVAPTIGWNFWLNTDSTTQHNDNGTTSTATHHGIGYRFAADITPFMAFMTKDGGPWQRLVNVNDYSFDAASAYDIVFTWTEGGMPNEPAPLPFDWKCLPNSNYSDKRC